MGSVCPTTAAENEPLDCTRRANAEPALHSSIKRPENAAGAAIGGAIGGRRRRGGDCNFYKRLTE
jgi:hypothetical protein